MLWREIAYLARYGKQQRSEIMRMTPRERQGFLKAVEYWIKLENPKA